MALIVDIEKRLGSFLLQCAFKAEGGVTGILGASGCGKSMTLGCIAGVVRPDAGHIELDGRVLFDSASRIDVKPQKRQMGLLFQDYALFPNMTLLENLLCGAKRSGLDKKEARARAKELLSRFELEELAGLYPASLSGGQQQRGALARILLSSPALLMLDEPFSALDDYLKWKLELMLSEVLASFEGSVLYVTHSRDEIYRICDRVLVMDGGRSEPLIDVRTLFEAPKSRAAAVLSGCKNFSALSFEEDGRAYARDWGIYIETEQPLTGREKSVGARAHYIKPVPYESAGGRNVIRTQLVRVIDDVFSTILLLRALPERGEGAGALLRLEMGKEEWLLDVHLLTKEGELCVTIEPKDLMVLL